jgi:hypothetical protein
VCVNSDVEWRGGSVADDDPSRAVDGPVDPLSFARRLQALFESERNPDTGRPYSVRHVAAEIRATGVPMSHTHLQDLFDGTAPNPRLNEMVALARFFGRSPTYFTAGIAPETQRVAMRLVGEGLSTEGLVAVMTVLEQVQRLETGRRPADTPESG